MNAPNVVVDMSQVIDAINANGANISSELAMIRDLIAAVNANVVDGNKQNNCMLAKILAAINDLDAESSKNFKLVIEAIGKKTTSTGGNVDLSGIEAKLTQVNANLDNILKAIKDHKVEVKVDVTGKFKCECKQGQTVNEGVIEDLNWLLG